MNKHHFKAVCFSELTDDEQMYVRHWFETHPKTPYIGKKFSSNMRLYDDEIMYNLVRYKNSKAILHWRLQKLDAIIQEWEPDYRCTKTGTVV